MFMEWDLAIRHYVRQNFLSKNNRTAYEAVTANLLHNRSVLTDCYLPASNYWTPATLWPAELRHQSVRQVRFLQWPGEEACREGLESFPAFYFTSDTLPLLFVWS